MIFAKTICKKSGYAVSDTLLDRPNGFADTLQIYCSAGIGDISATEGKLTYEKEIINDLTTGSVFKN